MIRIGVINIDVSHPKAWAGILLKENRARYVAVYNDGFRGDDEVEAFIRNKKLECRCDSVEALADMVDIVFVQGCNWDRHLEYAQRVLERGKTVFIDKPIAGSLKDCLQLEKLAAEGNIILGSSSARYAKEIEDFLARPESERGKILHVYGTSGVDEFNYGVHIVEAIGGLLGTGPKSVVFAGRSAAEGKASETFHISYTSGESATYTTFEGNWMPFYMVIMTTTGTFCFMIETGAIYKALLDRICDFMESGKNGLAPVEALTDSVKIMLAGKISREQKGGRIQIRDIPLDDPGYDGYAFEKAYAAKAAKIYLEE